MGESEHLGGLHDLTGAFGRPEVDRSADSSRTQIPRLTNRAEHHLIPLVGICQEFIVVHLDDEGNAVCVATRDHSQNPKSAGNSVAAAFDGKPDDGIRIEEVGVLRKRRTRAVFDTLIDRQDGDVAGACQPPAV